MNTGHTPAAKARLRLLATTDMHMQLTGFDYDADRPTPSGGLVRAAGLVNEARAEAEEAGAACLLLDNGDWMQGTALEHFDADNPDARHPLMQAFDHLEYDAIGLGNHDFDFGLDRLLKAVREAPCPVVCSNLQDTTGQNLPGVAPFAVLERQAQVGGGVRTLRIGLLGFVPPQTMMWNAHHLAGRVKIEDILTSARHRLATLAAQRCDLVVVLAHSGLSDEPPRDNMENAVIPLARVDGIDAVIAGHTHLHLPGTGHAGVPGVDNKHGAVDGKPVIMPGSYASHLGVMDLTLAAEDKGVTAFRCSLRPVAGGTEDGKTDADPALQDILKPAHDATRARLNAPVGKTETPIHSYFSLIRPDRSLSLVAAAQAAALRPLLQGTDAGNLPLLSAVGPCKFGGRAGPLSYADIPAGILVQRHVTALHVFPNELRAVVADTALIADWLEMSASLFHRIEPGGVDQPLLDPAFPGHGFDILHGLTCEIDLAVPPRFRPDGSLNPGDNRRVRNVRFEGRPLQPGQRFAVALNSYRASGGGHFGAVAAAEPIDIPPGMKTCEVIRDYLLNAGVPDPLEEAPLPWRFLPMPGTSVTLPTGPGAVAHVHEIDGFGPVLTGPDADGFMQLTISL